jgi:polysaccharide deacetylase family protein (PEP-CTERM system associated)
VDLPPDILTIDVEEWFHGHNYLAHVPPETWGDQTSRVEANTERCLAMLDDHGVRATFFVLGWTAERHPELVRRIAAAGHEIGCHSYAHPVVFRLDEATFRADLDRALAALRGAGIATVAGYRAPSFSLTPPVHGFLHVLRQYGFRYDCSLFPVHHPRYGQPASPRRAFRLAHAEAGGAAGADEELVVVPMTTWRVAGVNVPFAGGGYLRLLPWPVYRQLRARALAQGQPNIVYLHPWELDTFRPRTRQSLLGRLRSQGGQDSTPRKLEELLRIGRFVTLGEYVEDLRRRTDLPRRRLPLA